MVKIEILTASGCSKCEKARENVMKVIKEFENKVEYEEINITNEPDRLAELGLVFTPVILINGKMKFEGPPKESDLREAITKFLQKEVESNAG